MPRSRTILLVIFCRECPMGDYLSHILELTSCISQRLIELIEGFLFGDVERGTQDFEPSLSAWDDKSVCVRSHCSHGDSLMFSDIATNTHHLDCESWLVKQKEKRLQWSHQPTLLRAIKSFTARGLIAILYGVKCGCRLVSSCSSCTCMYLRRVHANVQGFISRVNRTLQGSSDDIGWLQRAEQLPPVEDGTTRFMELLHDVRSGIHHLPNTLVYLLIPGLFSNHSPLYFVSTKRFLSKMGLTCHIAKIHSEASVERNSWELKQYIEELYWGSGKRVLLLGHSKGGVDAAAALSMYWSDLKDKVAGLALVQSPYGGSPIASDILREGQIADKETRRIMEFIICKIIKGDMRALEDLTYEKRKDFISMYRLPAEKIPLVSFHTEARVAPGVLATMSHIAHAELPWLPLPQFLLTGDEFESERIGRKVPVVIPLAAAMAVSALHLKLRYGVPSDGLVTRCDAEVPGSVVVRVDRKLDHAWMVYTSKKKDQVDADSNEMCEALLTMLVEIGRKKLGRMNLP